jgi:hypothetical protein
MKYEWVIGKYTGDRAKSVKSLADSGTGYFVRSESGKGIAYEVEVAFRRPIDGPTPTHLTLCDNYQIKKLESLYSNRHGLRENN